jgi:nuclear GTP-binding protein
MEEHTLRAMERSNPLSRKALKRDAKRARRSAMRESRAAAGGGGEGGMNVLDRVVGLEFTLMANTAVVVG